MSYVLVSNDSVLNGPKIWSPRSFESTLREECGIDIQLPLTKTDDEPIVITDTVKICSALIDTNVQYNPKIEYLHGPFWDLSGRIALGTFTVERNSLESVKNYLCGVVTSNRYTKEISGFQNTAQDTMVTIDTSRIGRNIIFQKYLLMGDSETVHWKFPECWLTLTKSDLGGIVAAAASHIENLFVWESDTINQISAATTHEELDAIILE
jgi:hypothetical protein